MAAHRHFPRSLVMPPSRKSGWQQTPGTPATGKGGPGLHAEIIAFLTRKWIREPDYRLIKELPAFGADRIAVRLACESRDHSGNWFRSYGDENWEFSEQRLTVVRHACVNDLPVKEPERKYHWPPGRRPNDHPGLGGPGS